MKHVGDDVGEFNVTEQYDVVMTGPPCQPWSRANPDALGFDDDRADVFIQCAGIIREQFRELIVPWGNTTPGPPTHPTLLLGVFLNMESNCVTTVVY